MTDSLPDQKVTVNGKTGRLKTSGVMKMLEDNSQLPMEMQKQKIESELQTLQGDFEQRDGITVVGVKL